MSYLTYEQLIVLLFGVIVKMNL